MWWGSRCYRVQGNDISYEQGLFMHITGRLDLSELSDTGLLYFLERFTEFNFGVNNFGIKLKANLSDGLLTIETFSFLAVRP
jgi:hypothetical protein